MKFSPVEWILVTLVGVGIAAAAPWLYLRAAPIDWFIRYNSIEIIQPAKAGGPLELVSVVAKYSVESRTSFNDILRCDTNKDGVFENYSHQIAGPIGGSPHPLKHFPWKYRSPVPGAGSRCFVEANITYELTWWVYSVERHLDPIPTPVVTIQ